MCLRVQDLYRGNDGTCGRIEVRGRDPRLSVSKIILTVHTRQCMKAARGKGVPLSDVGLLKSTLAFSSPILWNNLKVRPWARITFRFKFQLCHVLVMWPLQAYFTFLSVGLIVCESKIQPCRGCLTIKWGDALQVLTMGPAHIAQLIRSPCACTQGHMCHWTSQKPSSAMWTVSTYSAHSHSAAQASSRRPQAALQPDLPAAEEAWLHFDWISPNLPKLCHMFSWVLDKPRAEKDMAKQKTRNRIAGNPAA